MSTGTSVPPGPRAAPLDQATVSQLEEERDFLLRSLDDLDAELAAGDVDDADYRTLRDDYTRRAAAVIRALESRQVTVAARRSRSVPRVALWVAGVVLVGVAAGLLLAGATGGRGSGTATGEIRASTRSLLIEAQQAFAAGEPDRAVELYDEVLEIQPGEVEALTYRGWAGYRFEGDAEAALADLDEAVAVDPAYPDARVFRASIRLELGDAEGAAEDLAAFDAAADQPPMAEQLLVSFRLRERVALARVEPVLLDDAGGSVADAGLTTEDLLLAAEQLLETGAIEDAVTVIDAGLDADPESPALVALVGWIDALVSQSSATTPEQQELLVGRALERLGRAVELDPALPDARVYRAILLTQLGRAAEAEEDLAAFCAAPQDLKLQGYLQGSGLACPDT